MLSDYQGRKRKEQIDRLGQFYWILEHNYGYVPSETEQEILSTKHELFREWKDLTKEEQKKV